MRITVDCVSCGRTLRIGDRHAGKRAKCRHCGHVFTVPVAVDAAIPAVPTAPASSPPNGDAEPELVITEAAPDTTPDATSEATAAALRDIAESLRSIHTEVVRTRKMIFRLVFWPLVLCILLGIWMWWTAASEQRQMEKLLKGMGGNSDLNKLLKDAGL